jgi:hypothetical protein
MRYRWLATFLPFVGSISPVCADQFESIDGKALVRAMAGSDARAVDRLTIADLGALPAVLKDARSSLLVVKTSKGNVARLLVVPELRKPAEGGGPTFPVFVLERFDTFDAADLSARMTKGREIVLFPGFQVDLDTGQVVPEGQGGDIGHDTKGTPAFVALNGAKLFTIGKAPAPDPTRPPQPTPGRAVVPTDFAGRYRLFGNGQWAGTLDLKVEDKGEVFGQFRSDTHGASYPVTGQVAADVPNKITFNVKFPRSHAEFEGFLWTDGKGALAGTFRLLDRTYGFFAIREGGRFGPEGSEGGIATKPKD